MDFARFLVMVAGMSLACATSGRASPQATEYPDFRKVVQDAKSKVFPAVVYVKCLRESNEAGKKESIPVSGSGVILSQDGEVLTNWHVVEKATSVRCLMSDGRHADAKILGCDKDTDLALLRLEDIEKQDLPCARLGDSTVLRDGDFVMAMGAPWGLNRSVSIGIISCTSRYLEQISEYSLWLQTDAAINPGNSGGPLVNTAGEVIGINARGMSWAEGMGFAIPSETIKIIVPQLRELSKVSWSWTGLQLQPLHDFGKDMYFDETEGIIVAGTDPDSPARRCGIRPRDRIIEIEHQKVTAKTEEDLPAIRRLIGLLKKGIDSEFKIVRGDNHMTFKLAPREKGKVEGDELALERFDFTVKTINQFDNPGLYFHCKEGVFVYGVKYPGNASDAGLSQQDILLKIDGKDVKSIEDVKRCHEELTAQVDKRNRVLLVVMRSGLMRQVVLDFSRDYQKD
jgi:serine protease Do